MEGFILSCSIKYVSQKQSLKELHVTSIYRVAYPFNLGLIKDDEWVIVIFLAKDCFFSIVGSLKVTYLPSRRFKFQIMIFLMNNESNDDITIYINSLIVPVA